MGYLLDFTIPQGPTGPTGPTGPGEGLNAYGGKYNNSAQTINLGVGTQSQINLSTAMPSLNVTNTTSNSVIITESGTYEINYYVNLSAAVATTVTMAVRANATNIPSTVISRPLSVGTNSIYSGSTIVTLASGTILDMAVSALIAVGLNLGSGVNASLSVKKLN